MSDPLTAIDFDFDNNDTKQRWDNAGKFKQMGCWSDMIVICRENGVFVLILFLASFRTWPHCLKN